MSSPTVTNGSNGYLSVSPPDGTNSPSARRRSASVTPSVRSSVSRITVVEDRPELAIPNDHDDSLDAHDFYKTTTKVYAPKYTWFEHLLGLFCVNVAKKKKPRVEVKKELIMPEGHEINEIPVDETSSPWILPVYVYSSRKDTDKHLVVKEAKCTIDTGNDQGNIVSRDFVVNVLQFPEANFRQLSEKEKKGAIGITGKRFVPEAAIYLTWYHKKSTRVFRDMRFLITPNQHCDLIIGAYSIQANQLLDVPNLIARSDGPDGRLGRTVVIPRMQDPAKKTLDDEKYKASKLVNDLKSQITKDKKNGDDTTAAERELVDAKKQYATAKKALDDYNARVESQSLPGPSAETKVITPTDGTSQSTGIDNEAKESKPENKRSWSVRLRGSRSQG